MQAVPFWEEQRGLGQRVEKRLLQYGSVDFSTFFCFIGRKSRVSIGTFCKFEMNIEPNEPKQQMAKCAI